MNIEEAVNSKKVEYMRFAQMNRDYLKEKYMKTVKQSNMQDMEVGMAANAVMASGSIEAAEQFAQLLISRTKAVAETKRLQAANAQLLIENDKLIEQYVMPTMKAIKKVDVKLATCTDTILIRR